MSQQPIFDEIIACAHGVRGGWSRDCRTKLYCPHVFGTLTCQTESRTGFVIMIGGNGGKSRFIGRPVDQLPIPKTLPSCASSALTCSTYLSDEQWYDRCSL